MMRLVLFFISSALVYAGFMNYSFMLVAGGGFVFLLAASRHARPCHRMKM